MKKYGFLILISVVFTACQPKLNVPAVTDDNKNLNSLTTLEIGDNIIFLQDFILNPAAIDSVTSSSNGLKIAVSADKLNAKLTVQPEMEQFVDVNIWVKGVAYSLPCRKTDKIDYTFSFDAQSKRYKRIQIAGQMNDWTASRTPDLKLNEKGLYEVTINLSPGTYLYQMALDGEQNHDVTNPNKVDNGFGKYNSILQIGGKNDSFPALLTDKISGYKISLSLQNQANNIFVYWQNYRLPNKFLKIGNKKISINIPAEARKIDRSFIRVWASNEYGVSNEILIPLQKSEVLTDSKYITPNDKHAQIMYFMLVDRFKNGDASNDKPLNRPDVNPKADYWGGDLAGLQQKIEDGYFEKLGVNTLWISPLNQNPTEPYGYYAPMKTKFSGYHGYWPVSSSQVDFRFGTNDEFKTLVSKAHENKINVLLDYVANHVHEAHPLYKQHPEFATNLYLPDGSLNVEKWDEQRLTTWFDTFMPSLDFSNPKVVDMMTDSAILWMKEFNLDGFRHDACKHVNLEFWRMLTLKMKQNFPDKTIFQIGETYGSPRLIASYLTTGMLNGQFDFNVYDIANTTFAGIGGSDLKQVETILNASLNIYGNHNLMGYISGNHDKPRFMAYASGDLKFGEDTKAAGWKRKIGITDSTAYDKFFLFHAFNLTIPGIPVLYYGDEIGMTGGNDPDCRRMMRFDGWNKRESKLWNSIAKLTHLRRNNPVMMYGDFMNIENTGKTWVYARKYFDKQAIVFINNSDKSCTFEVELPKVLKTQQLKATFGTKFETKSHRIRVVLPAYSVEVLIN
ncbi:MAG: alpha-amylase family glycosyl hydrolase [Paludibacter sp.]|nr:alpha-amylase family glycosyl hydrolase [Paludibacter sp.]